MSRIGTVFPSLHVLRGTVAAIFRNTDGGYEMMEGKMVD
jgi:hypothetical protein